MSQRTEQVSSLIHRELGLLFARDLELPEGVLTTITDVVTDPDLRHARVRIIVTPKDRSEETLKVIRKKGKDIQRALMPSLSMKFSPRLSFRLNEGEQHASHVEDLLDSIQYEEQQKDE